jgi:dehydrogenase/reductase SDR family protein 7B
MKLFEEKVVWITGASSGIGEALVYEFVKLGATIIASSNCKKELSDVRENCGQLKDNVHIACFDLMETDNIADLVKKQIEKFGRIEYLINIGGISQRARVEETPISIDRKIMEINYFGTIALSKAVLPYMIESKRGHILATSSISGRFGFPLRSAYSASKQAIHGFIETVHLENKQNNVRGSVIIPGRVRTDISIHALLPDGSEQGSMDPGQEKGITPEKAAQIIIKGIRRNKREIKVGGSELIMLYIRKYFPSIFFNIASKIEPK